MANIDNYANKVWPTEGGYGYDPRDAGGPTKYGITLAVFKGWAKQFGLTPDVPGLKQMTRDQAKQIMKKNFWDFVGADSMSQPVAEAAMEWAWGSGTGAWSNFKKFVLSKKNFDLNTQDPETALKIATFMMVFKWNHCLYYMAQDKEQEVWIPGWYLRCLIMLESWYTGKFEWYGRIYDNNQEWIKQLETLK